jgi:hypothetical protein
VWPSKNSISTGRQSSYSEKLGPAQDMKTRSLHASRIEEGAVLQEVTA